MPHGLADECLRFPQPRELEHAAVISHPDSFLGHLARHLVKSRLPIFKNLGFILRRNIHSASVSRRLSFRTRCQTTTTDLLLLVGKDYPTLCT